MDDDRKLDETLEETFPASDAPANTVETGIRIGDGSGSVIEPIVDNAAAHRFEFTVDGETGFLRYERTPDSLTIIHTEVPPSLRGRHFGDALVSTAIIAARSAGLRLIVVCPFARAYLRRHPAS